MPTLEEMSKVNSAHFNQMMNKAIYENNALLNRLKAADFGYKKPTAWEAFRRLYNVKAAVRWCTRWAWDGYCDCD